jgi:hypothetical protein
MQRFFCFFVSLYYCNKAASTEILWDGSYLWEGVRDTGPLGWLADQGYGSNVWEIRIGIEHVGARPGHGNDFQGRNVFTFHCTIKMYA